MDYQASNGENWTVYYRHHKEERSTMEYPGCPAEIEITWVGRMDGKEIPNSEISQEECEAIEEACWNDWDNR